MKRIEEIDALRGFALFGIMMTHMFAGFMASLTPPQYAGFNIIFPIDAVFEIVNQYLLVGKFYAIFSMLFGLSFYLILDGKKGANPLKFAWRLVLLFLIGYVHHIHYRGDFLTVYAIFGMALIPFRNVPTKVILVLGLFLAFNGPGILIKTISLIQPSLQQSKPLSIGPNPVEQAIGYFQLIIDGAYRELIVSNSTIGFINKYNYMKFSGRISVLPGLFLLGLWVGRKKWHENIAKIPLIKLILVSVFIGIALIFIDFYFATPANSDLARYFGSIAKDASNFVVPLLYIGLVLLLYRSRITNRIVKQLIPVGKMGLTTYVLQTAFGVLIFYGYGLGLLLTLSGTAALGLGILFFILQIFFSKWWFTKYKFGPLEWLWRCGTDRSWQAIKIPNPSIHTV